MAVDVQAPLKGQNAVDFSPITTGIETGQKIAGGQVDLEQKKLLFGASLLSTASDDQSYQAAKTVAQRAGIDTSGLPPTWENGGQQYHAQAMQQLPYLLGARAPGALLGYQGTMMRTGLGYDRLGNQANLAQNEAEKQLILGGMDPASAKQTAGQLNYNAPQNPYSKSVFGTAQPQQQIPQQQAPAASNSAGLQPVAVNQPQYTNNDGSFGAFGAQSDSSSQPGQAAQPTPSFSQAKANQAGLVESAKESAKLGSDNSQKSKMAVETFGRLNQNLDALLKLNDVVPVPNVVGSGTQAEVSRYNPLSDKKAVNAYDQFQQVNQQQVINGISQLISSGQIRGNQYLERIINRGYAVDPNAPKETRQAEINILRNELNNAQISASNMAGGNEPYKSIPVITSPTPAQNDVVHYTDYFK
jgi:hypothetical protein